MTTTTRSVHVDAWANEARPADTHGPDASLSLQQGSNLRRWSYLFAARPWAASRGVTVASALLHVWLARPNTGGAMTIRARRIESTWQEKQLAWKNKPDPDGADDATAVVAAGAAVGTMVEFDVTAALQNVADGALYFGFRLAPDAGANAGPLWLGSSESSTQGRRPALIVAWSSPPDPPSDLRPSGARYVSTNKPVLSWTFGDALDPLSYQSAYQVQLDDAADFGTPTFDTGTVAGGLTSLALASTAYAGLPANGAQTWWRVRVTDESGRVSDWSDPVIIRYAPLGVVTISAPGATTPDFRPVVTWSFAPAALPAGEASTAQKSWRAWLEQLNAAGIWATIADSGLVTGPDLTWSPATSLTSLAGSYRARVQIGDALQREANVSALSLATATQPFTYAPGGGVTDPTGLVATVVNGYAVQLAYSRATPPDHWAVEVDGAIALDGINVTPTGTAYVFTFYGLRPRIAHTVKLHAVELIGGAYVASPGASVAVTTDPVGIWLVDPTTGLDVQLAGNDDLAASIGEASAVYDRLGDQVPVVVTDVVRGYEGAVSGLLVAWNGRDPRVMKDRLISLRYASSLRLVLGDLNVPVAIYDVTANPTPDPDTSRFVAAFSFVQVGEFPS